MTERIKAEFAHSQLHSARAREITDRINGEGLGSEATLAKRRAQELGLSWCARRGPRNKTSRKFEFSNMLDFAVCMRCMPSRRLRRFDKPLILL